jgi:hypothetical protein
MNLYFIKKSILHHGGTSQRSRAKKCLRLINRIFSEFSSLSAATKFASHPLSNEGQNRSQEPDSENDEGEEDVFELDFVVRRFVALRHEEGLFQLSIHQPVRQSGDLDPFQLMVEDLQVGRILLKSPTCLSLK